MEMKAQQRIGLRTSRHLARIFFMITSKSQRYLAGAQFIVVLLFATGSILPAWTVAMLAPPPSAAAPHSDQRTTAGKPDILPHPGLPNFHLVAPGIYRGAAPTAEGLTTLKSLGVHTIIDLRYPVKEVKEEKARAIALGFTWINLPMGSDPPTTKQVTTFLAVLAKAPKEKVFVHCQHGADRTGCMIGIYRVAVQGWPFTRTWAEMRRYGFNPRWTKLTAAVQARIKPAAPVAAVPPKSTKSAAQ